MSFLAPIWLAAAAVVGAGLIVAHLFSTSVPPRDYLPTVRFVPEGAPLAVMRTRRLSDVLLLLMRLLAVALLGLALAGTRFTRDGPPRVVLIDASRAVGSFDEVRDSARAVAGDGAVLIAFDSSARPVSEDALAALTTTGARGSLSAALVAAHHALANVTDERERAELVIASPIVREEVDSATADLLKLWPGPIRLVRVAAATKSGVGRASVRAVGDDPVAAAVSKLQRNLHAAVRIVRTPPARADSAWAHDSGGVLVVWPADTSSGVLVRRAATDTATGIASGPDVVVGSFLRTHQPRAGRAVARWSDGEAAATESPLGSGCIREVAIPVDPIGDVALRASFRGIVASLAEPCGGARDFLPWVIPSEARNLPASRQLQIPRSAGGDALATWFAAFALAVLIAEQFLRARVRATA